MPGTIVVVVLLIILIIFVVMMFNKIVKSGNENIKAVKTLDQVLKRRLELIPNLQEIVRNYPEEENVSLNDIDSMREALSEKMTVSSRQKLEDKFSAIFKNIFDSMEKYPELKSSNNFINLKNELTAIEKDIEITRRAYNDTTRSYNALIKKSPYKILASILGYSKRDFFDVDLVTKEEVAINFVDRRQGER
ncbi:MAG: LemA family protein [Clostridia bacterium]|jgi:LemA protein|nr:LemA family protein [Clostridia bacterium]